MRSQRFLLQGTLAVLCFTLNAYRSYGQLVSTLSGTITSNNSKPVQGAIVGLLNTNYVFITDKNGAFSFDKVSPGTYVLHISHLTFTSINQKVTVTGQDQSLSIKLTETGKMLDEVVVTANKREEDVQKVPVGISTLSAKQVQAYKVWNLKDITAISPNVYSASPGDKRNVTGIRGIVTTSYDPAVTTYIDGVSQFSLDTYIPQLFDAPDGAFIRAPNDNKRPPLKYKSFELTYDYHIEANYRSAIML